MKIYSYNVGSASAKALSESLNAKIIKHTGKDLDLKNQILINWGSSHIDRTMNNISRIINWPDAIAKASNKLSCFQALDGNVNIPEWSDSKEIAITWLADQGTVVIRSKLNGHSGDGITIIDVNSPEAALIDAPLYTKYVKKANEYRLHVYADKVFFVQQKKRKIDVPDDQVNWQVRNHQNGFIYANQDVEVSEGMKNHCIKAVHLLGLDFGAVDVIEKKDGSFFILEVNTAPGLSGSTLEAYTNVFKELV